MPWTQDRVPYADGMATSQPDIALGILTADCAAVLFVDPRTKVIGAAHAGWRGALLGILEATVTAMHQLTAEPSDIIAAIGPRISRTSYEVGIEFHDQFVADDPKNDNFFDQGNRKGHFLFDLASYINCRLRKLGLRQVYAVPHDTFTEEQHFFSYRRSILRGELDYGRCLSAILLKT
jgi:YfiH family protein